MKTFKDLYEDVEKCGWWHGVMLINLKKVGEL